MKIGVLGSGPVGRSRPEQARSHAVPGSAQAGAARKDQIGKWSRA